MKELTEATPNIKIISTTFAEIKSAENDSIQLTDTVSFNQREKVKQQRTHQRSGFLTAVAEGEIDNRMSYDIISPMVDVGVVNIDFDSNNMEPYTDNNSIVHEFVALSLVKHYNKQANVGEKINNDVERFVDEGDIVSRKVNNGNVYEPVDLMNLFVIDQTAKSLEDTTVIELVVMKQSELQKMKEWKNVDKVIKEGNHGSNEIPSYEVYYRYGEIKKGELKQIKEYLNGGEVKEEDDDNDYVNSLVVIARRKCKDDLPGKEKGILLFAEESQPETIKISRQLIITKYKPYIETHFGAYRGTWLRGGYRLKGAPYQNRANELTNELRELEEVASKQLFWSTDKRIAAKNVLSAVKNGQILNAEHLALLNNQFPNLSFFADEWNKNIRECEKALKAFEVASGESLPSSTSATAVAVQNTQIGKYHSFKQEKLGLYYSEIYKRWILPTLLEKTDLSEKMEIIGDPSFIEEYATALATGQVIENEFKAAVLSGETFYRENAESLIRMRTEALLKSKKLFFQAEKDFFKDVELYVGFNPTGEQFNKQARFTNGQWLIQSMVNPAIQQNPDAQDILYQLAMSLGFKLKPRVRQTQPMDMQSLPAIGNMPLKESSLPSQVLKENSNGLQQ